MDGLVAGLLLWSLVWLGAGTVGLYVTRRELWRCFWFMSAMWGLVDGGIAWYSLVAGVSEPGRMAVILKINAGLDVVYVVVGSGLLARKSERMRGFGGAIVVQGAFLLAFDLYFWRVFAAMVAG